MRIKEREKRVERGREREMVILYYNLYKKNKV